MVYEMVPQDVRRDWHAAAAAAMEAYSSGGWLAGWVALGGWVGGQRLVGGVHGARHVPFTTISTVLLLLLS